MESVLDLVAHATVEAIHLATNSTFGKLLTVVDRHTEALLSAESAAADRALKAATRGDAKTRQARVAESLQTSWRRGARIGNSHLADELPILGLPRPGRQVPSEDMLEALLADVARNFADADLSVAEKARRSALSASVAVNRAYSETQLRGYEVAGVTHKVWVTRFHGNTCPTCASLHGTIAQVGAEFPHDHTFASRAPRVYGDLRLPPRHPFCRCRVVAYVDTSEPGPSPATMQAYAKNFAENQAKTSPLGWPGAAPDPAQPDSTFMTADQVRRMPPGVFASARRFFTDIVMRLTRRPRA